MAQPPDSLAGDHAAPEFDIRRVTTKAPFPRGLAMVDDRLYVLCRGRVRGAGGVSAAIEDQAGAIYIVDPEIGQPISEAEVSQAVKDNGEVLALPTDPPFNLWDRTAQPPERDRETDRPYCALRHDPATSSLYLCAFSGIDKPSRPGEMAFSKNLTDALLRYDLRTSRWYEVERHHIEAGGSYPHHDPRHNPPPHGWLNGPDNCLVVGTNLYAVAKDNSVLVRYDLSDLANDPEAGPPPSELVFDDKLDLRGRGSTYVDGHSMLAQHGDWLYVGFRTSSQIVRLPMHADGTLKRPLVGELVAQFEPYDPKTLKSANITDMDFDSQGNLYVISAEPSRVYRFAPDPDRVFDARQGKSEPWLDLAVLTGNPKMKSENILIDKYDRIFVTSGDGYDFQNGAGGTVYRVTPK